MKHILTLALVVALATFFASCDKGSNFDYYYYSAEEYALLSEYLNLPEAPPDFSPQRAGGLVLASRAIDRDKATLGKVLFYDKKLSKDGTVACANCHRQEFAFGDNTAVSKGVFDRSGDRNSIALMSVPSFASDYGTDLNGPGAKRFFWDNRAETAAAQSRGSMTNPKEMDMDMAEIAAMVRAQPYYEPLFRKAFKDTEVTEDRVTEAIAEFVNSIGSLNSRFDQAVEENRKNGIFDVINFSLTTFTPEENRGKSLYMLNCGSCHGFDQISTPFSQTPQGTFEQLTHASNGLDAQPTDAGVGGTTGMSTDMGTFKVPTLRNIAKSAPYMHDGRFATLEQVIDHYSTGIQPHANLHFGLKNADGTPKRFNFTEDNKKDLIAFLNTLTDESILADVRYANPFK